VALVVNSDVVVKPSADLEHTSYFAVHDELVAENVPKNTHVPAGIETCPGTVNIVT
jgi:hypothetical protein